MLAEWITRGAGDRDSRELLTAPRQPGRQPRRGRPDAPHQRLGRDPRPQPDPRPGALRRRPPPPHLDDEEVEPIRALALQNLQSLEDDPGTKVIYELRRRHFPDPWGRPSPGTPEGVEAATPDDLRAFHRRRLPAQRRHPRRRRRDRLAGAARRRRPPLRRLGARARAAVGRGPPARAATTSSRRPSRPRSPWPTRRATVDQPRLLPRPRRDGDPRRLLVGPPLHRGPREARALLLGLRQLREPEGPRRRPLLRRDLDRPRPGDPRRHPRRDRPARPTTGVEAEELETMRAGLKSSLIMQQESSMSRSGSLASDWYLPRPRPPARRDLRRPRRPDPRVRQRLRRPAGRPTT